jgi:hypothetical protein
MRFSLLRAFFLQAGQSRPEHVPFHFPLTFLYITVCSMRWSDVCESVSGLFQGIASPPTFSRTENKNTYFRIFRKDRDPDWYFRRYRCLNLLQTLIRYFRWYRCLNLLGTQTGYFRWYRCLNLLGTQTGYFRWYRCLNLLCTQTGYFRWYRWVFPVVPLHESAWYTNWLFPVMPLR